VAARRRFVAIESAEDALDEIVVMLNGVQSLLSLTTPTRS